MAGGEEKVGRKLHNNDVMSRTMSVRERRWRSVWEARQNTLFSNEFTDKLMSLSYMWACVSHCVCVCVCDALSDHHGSEVPLGQSAVRDVHSERISNIYDVVKLLLHLLPPSSSSYSSSPSSPSPALLFLSPLPPPSLPPSALPPPPSPCVARPCCECRSSSILPSSAAVSRRLSWTH